MVNQQKEKGQKLHRHPSVKAQSQPGSLATTVKVTEGTKRVSAEKAGVSHRTAAVTTEAYTNSVSGIRLDAQTARSAIIMSEIIGPPKAKRRRGRCR